MASPTSEPRVTFRLGLVLAVAAVAAIATTRLAPHVPPYHGVLAAAAALLTAAPLLPEPRSKWMALAATAIAALAASHVLARGGMPQVHDPDHVWGLWAYARAVHAGQVLPMWIPDLGAGMPLLRFYGPVTFLLALPGVIAGWAPVSLWKEAVLQAAVLSAFATLIGARLLGAGWRASLVSACALAFSPWRLTVFGFRGALGEATAFATAPLVAAAALVLLRERSLRAAWILAVATAILIPTHLITLFCLALVLVPVALVQELSLRSDGEDPRPPVARRFVAAAAPVLLATGIVAGWWLPAVMEGKFTSLPLQTETHRYFIYDEHGVGASDLLVRRGWDRLRSSLKASDRAAGREGEQMPFYVGAVLFGAALTAPWWSRSRRTWGPACGAATGLLFSSAPAAAVMTHLPAIHKLQFPWRFLTAGSVFAAFAVGLGASALFDATRDWRRLLPALALPALLIADAAPYTGAAGWLPPYHGVTHWVLKDGMQGNEPFDVKMRPVRQDWSAVRGSVRVGGLYLPPEDVTTPLSLFWIRYVEWTTPAVYRGFLAARTERDWAEGGVSLFYNERREQPLVVNARPYASLERGDSVADAGAFTLQPGRIAIRPTVPDDGARLVVLEQAFPGWEATVDGHAASIEATKLGFMAIALAGGTHDVVLEFTQHTPARRAGIVVSALTVLGTLLFLLTKRYPGIVFRRKRNVP